MGGNIKIFRTQEVHKMPKIKKITKIIDSLFELNENVSKLSLEDYETLSKMLKGVSEQLCDIRYILNNIQLENNNTDELDEVISYLNDADAAVVASEEKVNVEEEDDTNLLEKVDDISTEPEEENSQIDDVTEEPAVVKEYDIYDRYQELNFQSVDSCFRYTLSKPSKEILEKLEPGSYHEMADYMMKKTHEILPITSYIKKMDLRQYTPTIEDLEYLKITEKDGWLYHDGILMKHYIDTSCSKCVDFRNIKLVVKRVIPVLHGEKIPKNMCVYLKNQNILDTRIENLHFAPKGGSLEKPHLSDNEITHISKVLKKCDFDTLRTAMAILMIDKHYISPATINKVKEGGFGHTSDRIFTPTEAKKISEETVMLTKIKASPHDDTYDYSNESDKWFCSLDKTKSDYTDEEKAKIIRYMFDKIYDPTIEMKDYVNQIKTRLSDEGFDYHDFSINFISKSVNKLISERK